jgi:hypothetical protein
VTDALSLNLGVLLAIATLGIAAMLLLVSLVSYVRLRSAKLLFAGGAFLVLAIEGALWTWRGIAERVTDLPNLVLSFLVLGFLYLAVAKR